MEYPFSSNECNGIKKIYKYIYIYTLVSEAAMKIWAPL